MDSTGSILLTTIDRIRTYLDDPSLDAKYDNDFIVRQIIEPEMANVITALNNRREEPVICKFNLDDVADNAEYYELPPNVGQIIRIVKLDGEGNVANDIEQRDTSDPRGPGWYVDGRDLHFQPLWDEPAEPDGAGYEMWYIPSGDFNPHYSADGGTMLAEDSTFKADSAPDVGMLDMRENAYVGGVLRVWNAGGNIVEERVITGYVVSTRVLTVRTAFTTDIDPEEDGEENLRYEVVPEFMGNIWQAIAVASAMNLGVARNINEKQMVFLKEQFGITIQTAGSLLSQKINNKSIAPENSVLYTMLQRIQWGVPDKIESQMTKAFTDNDFIMRSVVIPKMSEIMTLINNRTDSPVVVRHGLSLTADQEYYDLPPCIHKTLRIAQLTTTGLIKEEVRQRSENDPNGNGWAIEGNRLSIRPYPSATSTSYSLWYVPSGDFIPHYANDGSLETTGETLTLTSGGLFSRMLGYVDKRVNAYEGATLRVFESDGSISERTITSHDAASGTVTVTEAFTTTGETTTVAYEIVTPWMTQIMSAVVAKSVLELVALKGQISEADLAILSESSKSAIQSVLANIKEKNAQNIVHNKDSALHMCLEKTKTILGDVAKELDYSDDYIFRHGITPEYTRVMSRIQNSSSDYVIQKTTISLVKDKQYYLLPACIGEIVRIVTMYDDGRIKTELLPRSQFNSLGPNWSLEGNELAIRPYPPVAEDVEIWYIPTTDIKPHYAENGVMNDAGTSLETSGLSDGGWGSQILGEVDRREDIYKGSVFRVLAPTTGRVQERIIEDHSPEGKFVTFRNAFTDNELIDTTITYEIVPVHFTAVSEAVAQAAAMNLLVSARRVTKAQHAMLLSNFKSAMKTVLDHFTFLQNRIPKKYEKDTVDNKDRYGGIYGIR